MSEIASASGTYFPGRLGFATTADIEEFVATLERYEKGELTAEEWRAFRLLRGVYHQRQTDVQMLRVKVPQGILSATQLRALALVAVRDGDGRCDVTTRQNFQFHNIRLAHIERAMYTLADVGMTTREACGNSIRTVTACPLAGVFPDEIFDVTPYADAFTRYLLRDRFRRRCHASLRSRSRAAAEAVFVLRSTIWRLWRGFPRRDSPAFWCCVAVEPRRWRAVVASLSTSCPPKICCR